MWIRGGKPSKRILSGRLLFFNKTIEFTLVELVYELPVLLKAIK